MAGAVQADIIRVVTSSRTSGILNAFGQTMVCMMQVR